VQFPKLISSYAIPPQSSISCAPCSVKEKSAATSTVKRYTYCSMNKPERQIRCFVEEFSSSERGSANFSTLVSSLEDSESPVVSRLWCLQPQPPARSRSSIRSDYSSRKVAEPRLLSCGLKSRKQIILAPSVREFRGI
ncbi:hypothetical protein CIHG_10592, partial [Coccidioides immitis H538.4]